MSFRVIVMDESDEDETVLMLNGEVDEEEIVDSIVELVEEGEIETFEECSTVCNRISEMLEEAGIKAEDHDDMIEALENLKLIKKVVEGNGNEGKVKKIVKKENGNGKKR